MLEEQVFVPTNCQSEYSNFLNLYFHQVKLSSTLVANATHLRSVLKVLHHAQIHFSRHPDQVVKVYFLHFLALNYQNYFLIYFSRFWILMGHLHSSYFYSLIFLLSPLQPSFFLIQKNFFMIQITTQGSSQVVQQSLFQTQI